MARTKVVVDPITRIEGHLRIEVQSENGRIADAWAVTTMFRGLETVLKGRDLSHGAGVTEAGMILGLGIANIDHHPLENQ